MLTHPGRRIDGMECKETEEEDATSYRWFHFAIIPDCFKRCSTGVNERVMSSERKANITTRPGCVVAGVHRLIHERSAEERCKNEYLQHGLSGRATANELSSLTLASFYNGSSSTAYSLFSLLFPSPANCNQKERGGAISWWEEQQQQQQQKKIKLK